MLETIYDVSSLSKPSTQNRVKWKKKKKIFSLVHRKTLNYRNVFGLEDKRASYSFGIILEWLWCGCNMTLIWIWYGWIMIVA